MPFTLNLNFAGLCLFVPESVDGELVGMHVLLPQCRHHPHLPKLFFDQGALTGSAPTGTPAPSVDLANCEIDLSGLSNAPPLAPPPPAVLNLTDIFAQQGFDVRVPRTLLGSPNPGAAVNARLRFDSGASGIPPCGVGGFWFFPTPDLPSRQLPIRVVWSLQVDAASLALVIGGINGGAGTAQPPLLPHAGVLDLWVFNSPAGQFPTKLPPPNSADVPDPLDPATHVACFYSLTGTSGLAVPLFEQPVSLPASCFERVGNPGLDVMCIGAVAMPRP
jgi:hypothetical protein